MENIKIQLTKQQLAKLDAITIKYRFKDRDSAIRYAINKFLGGKI